MSNNNDDAREKRSNKPKCKFIKKSEWLERAIYCGKTVEGVYIGK
jgi:hypothetical protein